MLGLFLEEEIPSDKKWIQEMGFPLLERPPSEKEQLFLQWNSTGLSLREVGPFSPWSIDFLSGDYAHKRKFGVGKNSILGKALGVSKGHRKILDGTLGWAQDSWMFLCMGLDVLGFERSSDVYALVREAWERAGTEEEFVEWSGARFQFENKDSREGLEIAFKNFNPDVVYFDFMFPEKKKGLSRKSMQLLQRLEGPGFKEYLLVQHTLEFKPHRVVVKRPLRAPPLLAKPRHIYEGQGVRYDIY